ncbi:NAD(P)/FAD-dependent oxidoreductase [Halobacillus fulvus]|nr:NAD(P)/FAD-dependent oxidoreductase [Halobacillus fulvus]
MIYDCCIIGGGIAGLQAAIQLGRYHRSVLILDANDGRSTICRKYNNILGHEAGISGAELRIIGYKQVQNYSVTVRNELATDISKSDFFSVHTSNGEKHLSRTVLLATGVKDNIPSIEGVYECLGLSIYVCPDCDGYEVSERQTAVIGRGAPGAHMALTLSYWTDQITLIHHKDTPIPNDLREELNHKNIKVIEDSVKKVSHEHGQLTSLTLSNDVEYYVSKAFLAMGDNLVRTDLAASLGAKLTTNHHTWVNPKTKETSIKGLWAAGDAAPHSELVTAAMGEASIAAIWIQKYLLQG